MEQNILVHAFHINNSDDLRGTDAFFKGDNFVNIV